MGIVLIYFALIPLSSPTTSRTKKMRPIPHLNTQTQKLFSNYLCDLNFVYYFEIPIMREINYYNDVDCK